MNAIALCRVALLCAAEAALSSFFCLTFSAIKSASVLMGLAEAVAEAQADFYYVPVSSVASLSLPTAICFE